MPHLITPVASSCLQDRRQCSFFPSHLLLLRERFQRTSALAAPTCGGPAFLRPDYLTLTYHPCCPLISTSSSCSPKHESTQQRFWILVGRPAIRPGRGRQPHFST